MYEEQKTENKPLVISGYPCETMKMTTMYGMGQLVAGTKKGTCVYYENGEAPQPRIFSPMDGSHIDYYIKPIFVLAKDITEEDKAKGEVVVFSSATLDADELFKINGNSNFESAIEYELQLALGGVRLKKTI